MRHPIANRKGDFLGDIDAQTAERLIESASDIALLLADDGTILRAVLQDPALATGAAGSWVGMPWAQTVSGDSRDKIAVLLREALAGDAPRWRQVNHPMPGEDDLPVLYAALWLPDGRGGRCVVAFGRDLRGTVVLQRRLVEAQQAMERDYWRFREAETRYRNLFQTSPEAVLVVDGQSLKVLEANPAADSLAGRAGLRMVGATLASLFDASGAESLQALVVAARAVGKREPVRLMLAQGKGEVDVVASLFRQDQVPFLLVRILPLQGVGGDGTPQPALALRAEGGVSANLLEAYARLSPDGLVFTDPQGRIVSANRAFANLAQLSAEDQARGEMLDRWLGRTGVELGVLITNLRQRGSVGLFTTTLRGEFGAVLEVEISASQVGTPEAPSLAFAVRDIGRRLQGGGEDRAPTKLARSAGELTELVGRVPMKDIVSETTDLIEQLCIETALQMTQDNRALAAQLLGLSRQSLYVKLRRFGIGDLGNDNPA